MAANQRRSNLVIQKRQDTLRIKNARAKNVLKNRSPFDLNKNFNLNDYNPLNTKAKSGIFDCSASLHSTFLSKHVSGLNSLHHE
jgi:hypothetical protein